VLVFRWEYLDKHPDVYSYPTIHSLAQEASLAEVQTLKRQIDVIKGTDVRATLGPYIIELYYTNHHLAT
jgi:hypothetical protein